VVLSRLWRTCAGLSCDVAPEPARAPRGEAKCVRPHRRPRPAARTVRGSLQLWQLASAVAAPPRSASLVFQLARQLPDAPWTVALPVPDNVLLGALGRAARAAPGAPARTPGPSLPAPAPVAGGAPLRRPGGGVSVRAPRVAPGARACPPANPAGRRARSSASRLPARDRGRVARAAAGAPKARLHCLNKNNAQGP